MDKLKKNSLATKLPRHDGIYGLIDQYFAGFGVYIVEQVLQIANRPLAQEYVLYRNTLLDEIGEQHLNEVNLFHGTQKIDAVCSIASEGFDWRLNGANGTAYGKGSYFSSDLEYSAEYFTAEDAKGLRYILIARVLLGKSAPAIRSHVRPPPGCHSTFAPPNIHVTFQIKQAYPQYIVFFKRHIGNVQRPVSNSRFPVLPLAYLEDTGIGAKIVSSDQWACSTCTFHNTAFSTVCMVCNCLRRPAEKQMQQQGTNDDSMAERGVCKHLAHLGLALRDPRAEIQQGALAALRPLYKNFETWDTDDLEALTSFALACGPQLHAHLVQNADSQIILAVLSLCRVLHSRNLLEFRENKKLTDVEALIFDHTLGPDVRAEALALALEHIHYFSPEFYGETHHKPITRYASQLEELIDFCDPGLSVGQKVPLTEADLGRCALLVEAALRLPQIEVLERWSSYFYLLVDQQDPLGDRKAVMLLHILQYVMQHAASGSKKCKNTGGFGQTTKDADLVLVALQLFRHLPHLLAAFSAATTDNSEQLENLAAHLYHHNQVNIQTGKEVAKRIAEGLPTNLEELIKLMDDQLGVSCGSSKGAHQATASTAGIASHSSPVIAAAENIYMGNAQKLEVFLERPQQQLGLIIKKNDRGYLAIEGFNWYTPLVFEQFLRQDDLLLEINCTPIKNKNDMVQQVGTIPHGTLFRVTLLRFCLEEEKRQFLREQAGWLLERWRVSDSPSPGFIHALCEPMPPQAQTSKLAGGVSGAEKLLSSVQATAKEPSPSPSLPVQAAAASVSQAKAAVATMPPTGQISGEVVQQTVPMEVGKFKQTAEDHPGGPQQSPQLTPELRERIQRNRAAALRRKVESQARRRKQLKNPRHQGMGVASLHPHSCPPVRVMPPSSRCGTPPSARSSSKVPVEIKENLKQAGGGHVAEHPRQQQLTLTPELQERIQRNKAAALKRKAESLARKRGLIM